MEVRKGSLVLVDTNAMAEAYRLQQWNTLHQFYSLRTVEHCIHEATRPNRKGRRLINAGQKDWASGVPLLPVPEAERFALKTSRIPDLDEGELDLLAAGCAMREVWFLCGPDRATIRAMHLLGKLEQAVSLERLLRVAGKHKVRLQDPHTESWLRKVRLELQLG